MLTLLLLMPPIALAQPAASVEPADVAGPDADGAFTLAWNVTLDAPRTARATLHVRALDGAGAETTGTRDAGNVQLPAGASRWQTSFLPAEGSGTYEVRLQLDADAASLPLTFHVDDASGASTRVEFTVEDAATRLALTSDSVNAANKSKLPGDALLTRATLEDGNGLTDVERVRFLVTNTTGALVDSGAVAWVALNDTHATLEQSFARAPMPAGMHVLTLRAERGANVLAEASRTFVIRDVAATLQDAPSLTAVAGENATLSARVVVADKNGVSVPLDVETRVYRGSARAEGDGFAARFLQWRALADADGHGRAEGDLAVTIPASASIGAHRVSFYINGTLLGSVPLDVVAAPTLGAVSISTDAQGAVFNVSGTGAGHVTARLHDANGLSSVASGAFSDGARLALPLPSSDGANFTWRVELRARSDGGVLAEANGTWTRAAPDVQVSHPRSAARLPATWQLRAPGYAMEDATIALSVVRWDGAPASDVNARATSGGRVIVEGPADLEAGRYEVRARLSWPNGTTADVAWHFEAGPWLRFGLGAPQIAGRTAHVPLSNEGGIALGRVVVEATGPVARVALERADGTIVDATARGPRWVFPDAALQPGAAARLRIDLADGPLPSGALGLDVRVLALPRSGA